MSQRTVRVGLMGFGKIGRNVFRLLHDREHIEVAAIVDIADPSALTYLLKYDSIYGRFPHPVELVDGQLHTDGATIPFVNVREPGGANWAELGVDIVVQATGKYRTAAWCRQHLDAGAHRVVLASTPEEPGDVPILLAGVNDEVLTPDTRIIALGSNTSNAVAPVLQTLQENFGIVRASFTTVHAFTNKERLADVPSEGFRSSRAAGENIIPAETNSPQILEQVMPQLAGKISATALNVPVPDGSTVDMVAVLERPATAAAINGAVKTAAQARYAGILEYTEDPIVSSDVIDSPYSGVFDSLATMVMEQTMAKVIVWFNNGWGYSTRLVETLERMASMESEEVPV